MHARDIIALIGPCPEATAQSWREHPDWPVRAGSYETNIDWARVLVLALRHQVYPLLWDACLAAGVADLVPVGIAEEICFRTELVRRRQADLTAALTELANAAPDVVSRTVILKGGALLNEYADPAHRPINDFDLLMSAEDFGTIEPLFATFGYWRKESLNGPTYYRSYENPIRPLSLDVHVAGPSKYWRPDAALTAWLADGAPSTGPGDIPCLRLTPELELVNIVVHIHEHLGSWIHALGDDDIALVRVLDVELLTERTGLDPVRCWNLATDRQLEGEFALGLWAVKQLRGTMPDTLRQLEPAVDLIADVGERVAVPGGALGTWSVPLSERAYLVDRLHLAFDVLRGSLPDPARILVSDISHIDGWRQWYREHGAKLQYRERVEAIGALARERLASSDLIKHGAIVGPKTHDRAAYQPTEETCLP